MSLAAKHSGSASDFDLRWWHDMSYKSTRGHYKQALYMLVCVFAGNQSENINENKSFAETQMVKFILGGKENIEGIL